MDDENFDVDCLHRCGMCGSCGSEPYWSPEATKHLTPSQKARVLEKVEAGAQAFISERDGLSSGGQLVPSGHGRGLLVPIPAPESELGLALSMVGAAPSAQHNVTLSLPLSAGERTFCPVEEPGSAAAAAVVPIETTAASAAASHAVAGLRHAILDKYDTDIDIDATPVRHVRLQARPDVEMTSPSSDPVSSAVPRKEMVSAPGNSFTAAFADASDESSAEDSPGDDLSAEDLPSKENFIEQSLVDKSPSAKLPAENLPDDISAASSETSPPPSIHSDELYRPEGLRPATLRALRTLHADIVSERASSSRRPHFRRGARLRRGAHQHHQHEQHHHESDVIPHVYGIDHCDRCERTGKRLEDLETHVQALESALRARAIMSHSMRSPGMVSSDTAILRDEVDSLRTTVFFLFRKLQKYEVSPRDRPEVH